MSKKTKVDPQATSSNTSKVLFVGNLSWNVDEDWLGREFAKFGEIESVRVMTDRQTQKPKG